MDTLEKMRKEKEASDEKVAKEIQRRIKKERGQNIPIQDVRDVMEHLWAVMLEAHEKDRSRKRNS